MKKISLFVLTASFFFFSGCITVIEKYTINKNGSGSLEYTIDMSEMYEMMSAFSDSSGIAENPEIDQNMRHTKPELEMIKGISEVELTGDIKRYIAGIKFNFRDAKALNQALSVLLNGDDSIRKDLKYVDINRKNFTRYSLTSDQFNKEDLPGSEELDAETMKSVLESMKYKIIVCFEKPVSKVTTLAPFTQDENSVTIETTFSEIFNNKDFLRTSIKTR